MPESQRLSNARAVSAWTNNRWIFTDSPLREVVAQIEDTYGLQTVFGSDTLGELKVNGVIPTDNLDDVLVSLESILSIHITRTDKSLHISSPRAQDQ